MKKLECRIMRLQDSLMELANLGSPVDLAVAATECDGDQLEIEQFGNSEENKVFELEDGRTAYMLSVGLINQTSKAMYIDEVELQLPWGERFCEWLLPHTVNFKDRNKAKASSYDQYRFPGKNGLELPTGEVINHALTQGSRLCPRRPVRGWLLATGRPMRKDLIQGTEIKSSLVITTSDHVEHCMQMVLWTERLQARPTRPKRRASLFENPIATERLTSRGTGIGQETSVPIRHDGTAELY